MNSRFAPVVLLASSDALLRSLIQVALQRRGYTVVACATQTELKHELAHCSPALLIVDLLLSGCSSLQLIGELKAAGCLVNCKTMVLSGLAFEEVVRQAAASGVDAFITRPVDPDALASRVAALCPWPEEETVSAG